MHTRNWTECEKDEAADLVTSYVDGLGRALQKFEVDQEELDDILLDLNVEKCSNCGWYVDSRDLLPDGEDNPDGFCIHCRS